MRTPLLSAVTALVLFAPSTFAHDKNKEEDPWYFQFGAGAVFYMPEVDDNPGGTVDWDWGFQTSFGIGYDLGELSGDKWGWSAEFEGYFSQVEVDSDDLLNVPGANDRKSKNLAWLVNLIFDYHFSEQSAWYFGGGIGWANRVKFETWDQGNFDNSDTDGFAFTFKTGYKYNLGGRYDFLIGYRLFATEDIEIDNLANNTSFDIENVQHSIELAVRFGL